ncbi:MAG: pyridoxal phosphate-dependent aminotransferase [Oligoflexia bacterium]|nr:pyridoxal phosphate-dependent aminotransferase [Oligoflexia bacterium]
MTDIGNRLNGQHAWVDEEALADLHAARRRAELAGQRIVDLSMINPDISPARALLDRLVEASLKPRNHRYSVARGVRRLREAFAEKYRAKFGVEVDPETRICATLGAKDGLILALSACAEPGATVLMPEPLYSAHRAAARLCGLNVSTFRIGDSEGDTLAALNDRMDSERAKVVVLNFPNNPTGLCVGRNFWRSVGELAAQYDALVLNDFVYGELSFTGTSAVSMLSEPVLRERGLEIYSLSKAYSVPGWRIGAVLGSAEIVGRIARIKSHMDYGTFLPLQIAASYALDCQEDLVKSAREQYNHRAALVTRGLKSLGFTVRMPEAGCSVWAELPRQHKCCASEFCSSLMQRKGVLMMPGQIFGSGFERHVRLAMVAPEPELREVVQAIEEWSKGVP